MAITVLDREVYTETEAARLLRVNPRTLHYWLEGEGGRGGKHQPVIRVEPKGRGAVVTWAEFIEAGLLAQYRRDKEVKMSTLRAFIDHIRAVYEVPYPLAELRPWIDQGKERGLLYEAQTAAGLGADFAVVARVDEQFLLTPASQSFLDRIDWVGNEPGAYRPSDDPSSLVRCVPTKRFGKPSVRGISTEVIWEQHDAGLDDEEIAETYGLTEDEVFSALAYERTVGHAA